MLLRDKRKDEFYMEDDVRQIILSPKGEKLIDWHMDEDEEEFGEYDRNLIEMCYREDDEDGWGAGGGEYLSTMDFRNIVDGVGSVIRHEKQEFRYCCLNDLFRLKISFDPTSGTFSLTAALLETLCRDYHITITKDGLTLPELEQYVQPFYEWEACFPVIDGKAKGE